MEKSIKGTRTEQNLLKAFAGESQARTRYTFFASQAKKEGFEQIAGVFMETADQEKEHAKRFFKFLEGGEVTITAAYPTGPIGTTQENLLAAAQGEREEWDVLYRDFSKIAEEEGFPQVAVAFKMIATVEAEHESRYLKLLSHLTGGDFFKRDGKSGGNAGIADMSVWPMRRRKSALLAYTNKPISSPRKKTIKYLSVTKTPLPHFFAAGVFLQRFTESTTENSFTQFVKRHLPLFAGLHILYGRCTGCQLLGTDNDHIGNGPPIGIFHLFLHLAAFGINFGSDTRIAQIPQHRKHCGLFVAARLTKSTCVEQFTDAGKSSNAHITS